MFRSRLTSHYYVNVQDTKYEIPKDPNTMQGSCIHPRVDHWCTPLPTAPPFRMIPSHGGQPLIADPKQTQLAPQHCKRRREPEKKKKILKIGM